MLLSTFLDLESRISKHADVTPRLSLRSISWGEILSYGGYPIFDRDGQGSHGYPRATPGPHILVLIRIPGLLLVPVFPSPCNIRLTSNFRSSRLG